MGTSKQAHIKPDVANDLHETTETVERFRHEGGFSAESAVSTATDGNGATQVEDGVATAASDGGAYTLGGDVSPVADKQDASVFAASEHRATREHVDGNFAISRIEVALAIVGLTLWFVLFAGGILISSQPFREQLSETSNVFTAGWISAYVLTILFWTITNVGLLTCLAAMLGAIGYRTKFANRISHEHFLQPISQRTPLPFDGVHYLSAIMRGFGIYTLAFTGLLVLATDTLQNPDQGAYLRIASTMSIVGFYAGYDPATFAGLLDRVKHFFETK